jgi:hypothetical protein
MCLEETTGENVTQGIFFWNITTGDRVIFSNCPYGGNNHSSGLRDYLASRHCQCNDNACQSPHWLEPDTSQCKYRVFNDSATTDGLSILLQV